MSVVSIVALHQNEKHSFMTIKEELKKTSPIWGVYYYYLGMDTRTYLKNNLSAHGSVAKRLKMLTYYVYAPLFHRFAPCPEP